MIENVSQMNWPAARVRNTIHHYVEARRLQYMPIDPPAKRMAREAGLAWLAATSGIDVNEVKLMDPVKFVQQYVLGSREEYTYPQAFKMVHGTASFRYVPRDVAGEDLVEMARAELAAAAPAPPAPPAQVVEVPAEVELVVPQVERTDPLDHDDESATLADVAEILASLSTRVDAHVAEREASIRAENRAALNFVSDQLVATEMRFGLIDDTLDHMYMGEQSPGNVVRRLAAIIAHIASIDV